MGFLDKDDVGVGDFSNGVVQEGRIAWGKGMTWERIDWRVSLFFVFLFLTTRVFLFLKQGMIAS
jgi:hypothetical protein